MNTNKDEVKDQALRNIAAGAGIILIGALFSRVVAYAYRMLVARFLGPSDYGLISLGIALMWIISMSTVIGLHTGLARFVSFYSGKGELGKIKGALKFSLTITAFSGIIGGVFLFLLADWISNTFFYDSINLTHILLAPILRVFALAVPFFTLYTVCLGGLRGFKKIKYQAYAEDFSQKIMLIILTLFVIFLGYGVIGASLAYTIAIASTFFVAIYYLNKVFPIARPEIKSISITKELLSFSIPLMLAGIIATLLVRVDTIMLGVLKDTISVGIYNAAFPTALIITIVLAAFSLILLPVITELYAKNKIAEISQIYKIVTKWAIALSLPVTLVMTLFPVSILNILFGAEYVTGASALSILVVGYFFFVATGPGDTLLKTIGKTKIEFVNYSIILILDIILNLWLIPIYGLAGAAIATTISIVLLKILVLGEVYYFLKMHPFTLSQIKPLFAGAVSFLAIYSLAKYTVSSFQLYILVILFCVFLIIYAFLFLILKGFEKEDLMIMVSIEKRFGLDLKLLKRLSKKFL